MIIKLIALLFCVSSALTQNVCEKERLSAVNSGKQKVRGSNLGSWLVMESWMAGHVWSENHCGLNYTGSYLLEKCLGSKAKEVMEKHWSTWVTEQDFAEMSKHGVNAVRIPVGWWHIYDPQGGVGKAKLNHNVTEREYVTGGLAYLDKAFEWGEKHGVAILVDMHAAPGSQNGNDHSSPSQPGHTNWDKYPANVLQTVDSMELYAERYGKHPALLGFELLNEPSHLNITVMQDYFSRAYKAIRKHSADSYVIIDPLISPFESGTESHWTDFMSAKDGFTRVAMDLHYYSCFGGSGDSKDPEKDIAYIRNERKKQIADYRAKNSKLMFIGEWSGCFHANVSREGDFLKAEIEVFDQATLGWTYWSWSTKSVEWSLKTAFDKKWTGNLDHPC